MWVVFVASSQLVVLFWLLQGTHSSITPVHCALCSYHRVVLRHIYTPGHSVHVVGNGSVAALSTNMSFLLCHSLQLFVALSVPASWHSTNISFVPLLTTLFSVSVSVTIKIRHHISKYMVDICCQLLSSSFVLCWSSKDFSFCWLFHAQSVHGSLHTVIATISFIALYSIA